MEFLVLGELCVQDSRGPVDLGGPRQRRLLAALLIRRREGASVDRLADAVFGDTAVEHPEAALRTYVARLRRSLDGRESSLVLRTDTGYRLTVSDEQVDVDRFERLADLGRRQYGYGDAGAAVQTLRRADALWRGRPFDEFADEHWAAASVARVQALRSTVREALVDAYMACGRVEDAVALARDLAAENPFSEATASRLMVALYRSGRPADALACFVEYRRRVVDELGIDPGPQLVELHRRVLDRDPTLEAGAGDAPMLRGYRVVERLGGAADATVFAARLADSDRSYVLRVYRDDVADLPAVAEHFDATVRALVDADQPGLVPVVDGWHEPGLAVLVMRRLAGGTLQDRIEDAALTRADALRAVRRVGAALVWLHHRGLSHGRVRASSVLYDDRGQPFLCEPVVGGPRRGFEERTDAEQFVRLASMCWDQSSPVGSPEPPPWAAADLPASSVDVVSTVTAVLAAIDDQLVPVLNPYVGLRPFDEADSRVFFGRDDFVSELLGRLTSDSGLRLTLIVGGSGSGKSSVVRAGLVPRLRSGTAGSWVVATMTPGNRPFESLRHALGSVAPGGPAHLDTDLTDPWLLTGLLAQLVPASVRLLLVVDQFEELFTLAPPGECEHFLDLLARMSSHEGRTVHILGTTRADFFDRPLDHPAFGTLASRAALPLPAMTAAQLEQAVAGPARVAGRSLETGMLSELVTSVTHRPAALPSLQFTLHEIAERCPDTLTWAALDHVGGVDGAIAARAEELYRQMDPPGRETIRRLMLHLVVVPVGGEPTRRPVPRAELVKAADSPATADAVLETWIGARLLAGDRLPDTREPTVEIAHEAVLTRWPRLAAWLDAARERMLARARLEEDAASWEALGRDDAALLRGARLEQATEISREVPPGSTGLLHDYIAAGVAQRTREEQAREAAAAQRALTTRRLRRQRASLVAALVLAMVVGGLAIDQRSRAARSAAAAEARAQAATAGLVAASDTATESDWSLALLLAAEAYRIDDSPLTRRGLAAAVTSPAPIPVVLHQADRPHDTVVVDQESGLVAVKSPDGRVDVLDPDRGEVLAARLGGIPRTGGGALAIHGGLLATGGSEPQGGRALVYRLEDRKVLAELDREVAVADLAFSPDGQHLAAVGLSGRVDIYDVKDWTKVSSPEATDVTYLESVAWSTDGARVYAGSGDGRVFAWHVDDATGGGGETPAAAPAAEQILEPAGTLGSAVKAIVPIPGQPVLLAGQADAQSYLLDAATLQVVAGPFAHRAWGAAADPSGAMLALAEQAELTLLRLPDQETPRGGDPVRLAREVDDVAFARDGSMITVGSAGTVLSWQVDPPLPGLTEIPGLAPGLPTFSPDGDLLAMWGQGSGARLFDAATYEPLSTLALPDPASTDLLGIAFQPSRGRVVVSYCRRLSSADSEVCPAQVAAFDASSGRRVIGPVEQGPVLPGTTSSVRASELAGLVATGEVGGVVTLRDADTLQAIARLDDVYGSPLTDRAWLRMSTDGSLLMASVTPSNRLAVWDLTQPEPELVVERAAAGVNFFTPDGDVVVGNDGGQMMILDPRTGEVVHRADTSPAVARATFTADGAWLGASDHNRDAWLWSTQDWQAVAGPINIRGSGWDAVHPDGTHLLVNGDVVHRFPLDADTWYALACHAAGRNLTTAEWLRYFPDEPYRSTCPDHDTATVAAAEAATQR